MRTLLINEPENLNHWEKAFNDYLFERINTRYIEPISAIEKIEKNIGKGFSIVTIYCSLIEFFESLNKCYQLIGRNYVDKNNMKIRSVRNFETSGIGKLLSNKEIFIDFLCENPPFKNDFTEQIAECFYQDVRCSILHQAETKSNWIIKKDNKNNKIIEISGDKYTLYWIPFKKALKNYINIVYKKKLLSDKNIQGNFIFKFDKISNL